MVQRSRLEYKHMVAVAHMWAYLQKVELGNNLFAHKGVLCMIGDHMLELLLPEICKNTHSIIHSLPLLRCYYSIYIFTYSDIVCN